MHSTALLRNPLKKKKFKRPKWITKRVTLLRRCRSDSSLNRKTMITYKVTFFVFIFLIVKNVKGITVEKVESASKEATEIHFKKGKWSYQPKLTSDFRQFENNFFPDGEIVFDIEVEQPLSSAGKPILQRGKAALPNNLQIARAAYTPCHRMSSEIQVNIFFWHAISDWMISYHFMCGLFI